MQQDVNRIQLQIVKKGRSWVEDSSSSRDGSTEKFTRPLACKESFIFDINNGGGRQRRQKKRPELNENSHMLINGPMQPYNLYRENDYTTRDSGLFQFGASDAVTLRESQTNRIFEFK